MDPIETNENQTIQRAMQRVQQYWYVDGLTEIAFGGLCVVLCAYFWAQAVLSKESMLYQILDLGFVFLVLGAALLGNRLVRRFKERITYPRSGRVTRKEPTPARRIFAALLAGGIAALLTALFGSGSTSIAWMPGITGLLLSTVWLYVGFRIGLLRFYLLGAASLIFGGLLAFSGLENIAALGTFYGLYAVAMFLSGGITLRRYLQETEA